MKLVNSNPVKSISQFKFLPRLSSCLLLLALSLATIGCKEDHAAAATAPTPPPAPPTSSSSMVPAAAAHGTPQPKLPALKLWVGTNAVTAELATTNPQIMTGMMWRTNMAEMEGMLFVFREPRHVAFYMRNTVLPLTCAYIDPEGTILEIYDMKPLDESEIPSRSDQVLYVLEMNQGWFKRHGIKPGVVIATEHGTLAQTFRRR